MNTDPGRLCQLLTRLRTRLTSHLAHEESEALPLLATIMSHGEVGQINRAICGGRLGRRAALTLPWALASVTPVVRARRGRGGTRPAGRWPPRRHPARRHQLRHRYRHYRSDRPGQPRPTTPPGRARQPRAPRPGQNPG